MRLVEYMESGRSKTITADMAGELLKTTYSKSYKSKYKIFRGINGGGAADFLYIDPSKGKTRTSANTKNYYTLIIDNSPMWKSYPKRSRSIICSTDIDTAGVYGIVYNVYPVNGAEIGVCPDSDIWNSFAQSFPDADWTSLEDVNLFLERMMLLNGADVKMSDKSYNNMIKSFKIIEKERKPLRNYTNSTSSGEYSRFYDNFLESGTTLLDYMEDILSPTKNNFKIMKSGDNIGNDNEVWIGSPCVLIKDMASAEKRLNDYLESEK